MLKKCGVCGIDFKVKPSHYSSRKTCSKKCYGKLLETSFCGSNNPAFGKVYRTKETNPQWAENIRNATKGKINLGSENGMKKPEARAKVSASRKKMMENTKVRLAIAEAVSKAWADGKFDGVRVGQCKWFAYTKKDGSTIKLQGTWELAFAKWADEKGIRFDAHKGRIKYFDENGSERNYYPDFYVYDWNCWVDVKNKYHYELQKQKFYYIRKSNPQSKIKIMLKEDLDILGITI